MLTENVLVESGGEPVLRLVDARPELKLLEPKPIRLTAAVASAVSSEPIEPLDGRWSGASLKHARELRDVSLSQLADRTKVTRHHIENIEGERYDLLPSYIYLRGILLSVAKELRLDAPRVCRSYIESAQQAGAKLS